MTGVAELIRHIKAHPEVHDSVALAQQFEVEKSVVEAVLSRVVMSESRAQSKPILARTLDAAKRLWEQATSNIVLFLALTNVLGVATLIGVSLLPRSLLTWLSKGAGPMLWGVVILGLPLVQLAGISRRAQFRYVVLGSALYVATLILFLLAGDSVSSPTFPMLVASIVALGLLYLIIGVPFAVLGAFRRVRKEQKAYETMTRQQLLERLMWVRHALEESKSSIPSESKNRDSLLAKLDAAAPVLGAVLAFVTSSLVSLAMVALDPQRTIFEAQRQGSQSMSSGQGGILLVSMGLSMVVYATQVALGLCNRSIKRLVLAVLGYTVGYVVAALMPFAYVPVSDYQKLGWGPFYFSLVMQGLMIAAGYCSRVVYEHTVVSNRRMKNDPVALTEELVELEWRLVPASSRVTVLAVDVVGSTAMKRTADPLVAEWSFRAYQTWVESVSAEFGGKVQSTAGDGAIVGFEDPHHAIDAAIAIQERIAQFNESTNRLDDGFLLRIGIHSGEVQGDLGAVQFTRVIDVAAHIESKAPQGGIAVSETVIDTVGAEGFMKSAATTDGHSIFVLSPASTP